MDIQYILDKLEETRASIDKFAGPPEPGVYAIFLKSTASLPLNNLPSNSLLYIGCSGSIADRGNDAHFNSASTGFSTLRRSIGAILKESYSFIAIPRSLGSSKSNYQNYGFKSDDDSKLTKWINENLEVGYYSVSNDPNNKDYETLEKKLIAKTNPPLCLVGCTNNPYAASIKALRKKCIEEAHQHQQKGSAQ